jgi:tetratricopeptide (TPR) repeat protein
VTYSRTGRHDNAHQHFRLALAEFEKLGDHAGQARVHRALAASWGGRGRFDLALRRSQQARDLYLTTHDVLGQAAALNDIGWCHTQLGDHLAALDSCQLALKLFQELGNKDGEASTWDSLSYVHHQLGDLDRQPGVSSTPSTCSEASATSTPKPPCCPTSGTLTKRPVTPRQPDAHGVPPSASTGPAEA